MHSSKINISSQFDSQNKQNSLKINSQLSLRTSIPKSFQKTQQVPLPGSALPPPLIQNSQKIVTSMNSFCKAQNCLLTPRQNQIKCYINKPTQTMCSQCGQHTETLQRSKVGQTTYLWGIFLLFTTGICCILPCFIQQCKDKELICIRCCSRKQVKNAECCSCI